MQIVQYSLQAFPNNNLYIPQHKFSLEFQLDSPQYL
jgi:hypothetical protein